MAKHHNNVIAFPSGPLWTFLSFVEDGVDVIEEWYEGVSFEARISFDKLLKQNAKVDNHLEWIGYRHKLKGKHRKVFELEFTADKRANRILCVFDGRKRTVMLCGCYHKDKIWHPPNALDIALQRAKRVENGTAKLNIRKIATDF